MKSGEQKLMMRGVAAGTMIGLALGGIIALFIALRPDLFARLME
jgi:predicted alpha/beta superfamily hydrolase